MPLRIYADENIERWIIEWLRNLGHEVLPAIELDPSALDEAVLDAAVASGSVLVSKDTDFGLLGCFRPAGIAGIVLLRFGKSSLTEQRECLERLWTDVEANCVGHVVVLSPSKLRFRRLGSGR